MYSKEAPRYIAIVFFITDQISVKHVKLLRIFFFIFYKLILFSRKILRFEKMIWNFVSVCEINKAFIHYKRVCIKKTFNFKLVK